MRPVQVAAIAASLVDVIIFDAVFPLRWFRLSVHLRALIAVCRFRDVRHVFYNIGRAAPQLLRVLFVRCAPARRAPRRCDAKRAAHYSSTSAGSCSRRSAA
mgnify:CR=1 FL=1